MSGWIFLLVPAHPGRPGQRAVKRSCVCVCGHTICPHQRTLQSHRATNSHIAVSDIVDSRDFVASCIHNSVYSMLQSLIMQLSSKCCRGQALTHTDRKCSNITHSHYHHHIHFNGQWFSSSMCSRTEHSGILYTGSLPITNQQCQNTKNKCPQHAR